jgi:hypothetical protein
VSAHCENCRAPIDGAYCAHCGQSVRSPIGSLRTFAAHGLDEIARLDARLIRTLRALFLRPGALTREYLDGHRVRYTQPVQLYLIAAAAFFLISAYRPFVWIDTEQQQVVGQLPGMTVGHGLSEELLAEVHRNPLALEVFAERFASAVNGVLPVFLVVFVLLFSLMVYGMFRRREPRYLAHAVFALHWTAFYLLAMATARLFPLGWRIGDLMQLAALVWLTAALRRVYGQRLPPSLAKAVILTAGFLLVLLAWVASAMAIGMRAALA